MLCSLEPVQRAMGVNAPGAAWKSVLRSGAPCRDYICFIWRLPYAMRARNHHLKLDPLPFCCIGVNLSALAVLKP